jgi:hypothetical protein
VGFLAVDYWEVDIWFGQKKDIKVGRRASHDGVAANPPLTELL